MTHYNARTNEGRKGLSYSTIDDARFLELQRQGLTAAQMADQLGVTSRTIQRHRARLGLALDVYHPRITPELKARIGAMLDDGASISEVSRTLGTTHATIKRHYPDAGWDPTTTARYARMMRTLNHALVQHGHKPLGRLPHPT